MGKLFREVRHTFRMLLKNPGSSTIAVVTMAFGIGLTASMFAVIDGAVLRGLPFEEPERLMHLMRSYHHGQHNIPSLFVSTDDFVAWRTRQRSFEDLAAFETGTVNLSGEGLPERYAGAWISPAFLRLLRVEPILGRGFTAEEEVPGAAPVMLLGYHVWQKQFAGDPKVVGTRVRANSVPTRIAGVLPEGFRFPTRQDVWFPLKVEPDLSLEVFGRLKDDVDLDQAVAEMATVTRRLSEQYPETNEGFAAVIKPYVEKFVGRDILQLVGVMFGAVIVVLLIACFNVTHLLLGRALTRGRELAIRSALGSSRGHVIALILGEAFFIAIAGAALGVMLAFFVVRAVNAALIQVDPFFWIHIHISGRVLLFTIAATMASAFMAGLPPAIRASRPNLNPVLHDSTRTSTSFQLGWLSKTLVVLEVAFSCALMVGAVLMVRSVLAAHNHDLRFDPENVLTARVTLSETDYPEESGWLGFHEDLRRRLHGQAEVISASIGTVIPTDRTGRAGWMRYERSGETYESPDQMPYVRVPLITPDFFATYGVTLLGGRNFTEADRKGAPTVALVNESFARGEWPGESPIGQWINLDIGSEEEAADPKAGWAQVVGLVPNLHFGEFDNADNQECIYIPLAQSPQRTAWIVVKTRADPLAFADTLRATVGEIDPNLPLYFVRSMDQVLSETLFFQNLFGKLFTLFGAVALILASVGLYGVMAFSVSQRTQEMGVRTALGAQPRNVIRLILRQGLTKVVVGLALGLVLGLGMGQALATFLYQVKPMDPVTLTMIPTTLLLVSLVACLIPARRASAVDPIAALRSE